MNGYGPRRALIAGGVLLLLMAFLEAPCLLADCVATLVSLGALLATLMIVTLAGLWVWDTISGDGSERTQRYLSVIGETATGGTRAATDAVHTAADWLGLSRD